jgi:hypothetical protein
MKYQKLDSGSGAMVSVSSGAGADGAVGAGSEAPTGFSEENARNAEKLFESLQAGRGTESKHSRR